MALGQRSQLRCSAYSRTVFVFKYCRRTYRARGGVPYIIRPLGTLTAYGMTRRAHLKRASFALIEAPILRRAAAVHFTSSEEEREAQELNVSMRGVVIPLGVEELKPGYVQRFEQGLRPFLESSRFCTSRIDPKKNIEALLEAYAANPIARQTSLLLIAGSGEASYIARLKCRAQALGIVDHVIWLGHVDGQRKQDVFARADLFVLPSFSENFGIAAVEAMLAGLPCVLGEGVAVAKPAAAEGAALPSHLRLSASLRRSIVCLQTKACERAWAQRRGPRSTALFDRSHG